MNIASAFIKRTLEIDDFESWSNLRKHYLPAEYHSLFNAIEKHTESFHKLPTIEELKFGIRDSQTRDKLYSVEVIEVDADPATLLEYIKNEYAQREILNQLESYIDNSIAFENAEESINHLHQIVLDVEQKVEIKPAAETMEKITLFESDEDLANYMPLGLNEAYDKEVQFSPIDLVLLGGKRGAGKSVVCCNLASNIKNAGRAALYFTIEMNARSILQRCCAIDTGVPLGRLKLKNLGLAEWEAVAKWWAARKENGEVHYQNYLEHRDFDKFHEALAKEALVPNTIYVVYDPALTLPKIKAEVDKLKSQPNVDLGIVVVDYLNQVKKNVHISKKYEWTEQIDIATALKGYAQEYEVLFVSPYQIDATGEARFAKGILDPADAAYTLETYSHSDGCITFNCTKMRGNEEKGFTSEIDWPTLKIGPATALTPKEKKEKESKSTEEVDETIAPAPWET